MPTKPLSVAIIGLAHLHPRSYMPLFQALPEYRVAAVAEQNPELLESFQRDFSLPGFADWRELIRGEKIDLAMIFLPHADCPQAAIATCERGIHVAVEKPMSATADGLRQMLEAAQKAGVMITAPYVWRHHPVARRMKELIHEGLLGKIVACTGRCAAGRLHRYIEGNARWMLSKGRSGGGPMHNLGVHWIDLFRWFLEDEAVEVLGRTLQVNQEYDIEDHSLAMVQFSKGALLNLDISYTVPDSFPYGRDLYLSLRGTKGVLTWSPSFEGTHESLFVCSNEGPYAQSDHQQLIFDLPAQPGYGGTAGLSYLKELAVSIFRQEPPSVTGDDGLKALEIVEAIYRSARTGACERVPS
jgi:UDP-N-acetylglucosamine 3-dehydrogenase